jgi:hypothetical protein
MDVLDIGELTQPMLQMSPSPFATQPTIVVSPVINIGNDGCGVGDTSAQNGGLKEVSVDDLFGGGENQNANTDGIDVKGGAIVVEKSL